MRLYSFVNYYLSPLQHGLQTAHCVSDMSQAYKVNTAQHAMYVEWATKHKTIIICNGGNVQMLEDLHLRLCDFGERFGLPVVKFYEDEQSLNEALTSVAIIVPEHFYSTRFTRGGDTMGLSLYTYEGDGVVKNYIDPSPEFAFIDLIKSHRLA